MLVTTDIQDSVAIVTLNRPEAMNALSAALRAELAEAIRTGNIQGNGDRSEPLNELFPHRYPQDASNRALGKAGEKHIYFSERDRLIAADRDDDAILHRHVGKGLLPHLREQLKDEITYLNK